MIDEYRRLTFSPDALKAAIQAFLRKRVAMLPEGDIDSLEVSGTATPTVTVHFKVAGTVDPRGLEVEAPQLAAAMIAWCIRSRIPIPKSAKKRIERSGNSLALCFSIEGRPGVG